MVGFLRAGPDRRQDDRKHQVKGTHSGEPCGPDAHAPAASSTLILGAHMHFSIPTSISFLRAHICPYFCLRQKKFLKIMMVGTKSHPYPKP